MKVTFSSNSMSRYLPRYNASLHYFSKVVSKALVRVLIVADPVLIDAPVLLDIDEWGFTGTSSIVLPQSSFGFVGTIARNA